MKKFQFDLRGQNEQRVDFQVKNVISNAYAVSNYPTYWPPDCANLPYILFKRHIFQFDEKVRLNLFYTCMYSKKTTENLTNQKDKHLLLNRVISGRHFPKDFSWFKQHG